MRNYYKNVQVINQNEPEGPKYEYHGDGCGCELCRLKLGPLCGNCLMQLKEDEYDYCENCWPLIG